MSTLLNDRVGEHGLLPGQSVKLTREFMSIIWKDCPRKTLGEYQGQGPGPTIRMWGL